MTYDMGMLKFESPEEAQRAAEVFDRMQADANRYQWLKKQHPGEVEHMAHSEADWDAYIDAEMAAPPPPNLLRKAHP